MHTKGLQVPQSVQTDSKQTVTLRRALSGSTKVQRVLSTALVISLACHGYNVLKSAAGLGVTRPWALLSSITTGCYHRACTKEHCKRTRPATGRLSCIRVCSWTQLFFQTNESKVLVTLPKDWLLLGVHTCLGSTNSSPAVEPGCVLAALPHHPEILLPVAISTVPGFHFCVKHPSH